MKKYDYVLKNNVPTSNEATAQYSNIKIDILNVGFSVTVFDITPATGLYQNICDRIALSNVTVNHAYVIHGNITT